MRVIPAVSLFIHHHSLLLFLSHVMLWDVMLDVGADQIKSPIKLGDFFIRCKNRSNGSKRQILGTFFFAPEREYCEVA